MDSFYRALSGVVEQLLSVAAPRGVFLVIRRANGLINGMRVSSSFDVMRQQFVESVKQLSVYWALMNEPPPGTAGRVEPPRAG